ncbi:MAG: hypothetical protein HXK22_05195 [Alloprevotella tannerae]|nr:hypothetical protein [Alloprevotella tannerae]
MRPAGDGLPSVQYVAPNPATAAAEGSVALQLALLCGDEGGRLSVSIFRAVK